MNSHTQQLIYVDDATNYIVEIFSVRILFTLVVRYGMVALRYGVEWIGRNQG